MKPKNQNKDQGDFNTIIYNGNYYFSSKEPLHIKFLWLLDWFFYCIILAIVGLAVGSGLDKIPKKLDRSHSKIYVFIQAVGELLLIVGALFILILLFINKIPTIAP